MEAGTRAREATDLGRLVAFTDGVFAIAITLLVLNLDVPSVTGDRDLDDELLKLWPELLAYFLSFAVVGRFWLVHHRVFAGLHSFDGWLLGLNLAYLSFVVLVPFTTEILDTYGDHRSAVITYAGVLTLAGLVNWAMIRYSLDAGHVHPDARDASAEAARGAALYVPIVFALSIPVAFIHPYATMAMWVLLVLARPLSRRVRR
jgi:uncharacterized membrane protein